MPNWKPEVIALIMNSGFCIYYIWQGGEPFKAIYWLGAIILTIGLIGLRG